MHADVHMYPSVYSKVDASTPEMEDMKNPQSPAAFMFRKIAEGKGVAAVRECLPKVLRKMHEETTKLKPNILLEDFSKKIDSLDEVMNFKERAEGNRKYANAVSDARMAEHEITVSKI